ncbi:MAG TPA: hypothetical protein VMV00_01150 [Candidatus Baltobacteraceae bacterium]|nr:hypothetical protein [Candidatus Baltobacteraceae bacterium]
MAGETVVVRNTNKSIYKKFKQMAVAEDINLGVALTEAMGYWLKFKGQRPGPDPKNLLKLNGIIKTAKKVRWSEEIDQTLYGGGE